jgi:hypothetical protein
VPTSRKSAGESKSSRPKHSAVGRRLIVGLDVATVQAWEQGRRRPDRTARILLAVIAREPEAVRRALSA